MNDCAFGGFSEGALFCCQERQIPGAIDTSVNNYGQYTPLYTAMLGLRQSETMSPNGAMSTDWVNSFIMLLPLDDAGFVAQMAGIEPADANTVAALNPATVDGEAPKCAALRSALYHFWQAVAFMDYSTGMNVSVIGVETWAVCARQK